MYQAGTFLQQEPLLQALLESYLQFQNQATAKAWLDRIMSFADLSSRELCRLHGLLIAAGWLECRIHTGACEAPGRLQECYRVTEEGIQALRRIQQTDMMAEEEEWSGWQQQEIV